MGSIYQIYINLSTYLYIRRPYDVPIKEIAVLLWAAYDVHNHTTQKAMSYYSKRDSDKNNISVSIWRHENAINWPIKSIVVKNVEIFSVILQFYTSVSKCILRNHLDQGISVPQRPILFIFKKPTVCMLVLWHAGQDKTGVFFLTIRKFHRVTLADRNI